MSQSQVTRALSLALGGPQETLASRRCRVGGRDIITALGSGAGSQGVRDWLEPGLEWEDDDNVMSQEGMGLFWGRDAITQGQYTVQGQTEQTRGGKTNHENKKHIRADGNQNHKSHG